MSPLKYGFAIDRGGTFTDVYVHRSDGTSRIMKLLSEDRNNYQDAPTEAIRRVLEEETGVILPRETPIPTGNFLPYKFLWHFKIRMSRRIYIYLSVYLIYLCRFLREIRIYNLG